MKRSSRRKVWFYSTLGVLATLVLLDLGTRLISPGPADSKTAPSAPQRAVAFAPPFRVGDLAPDFALPDSAGKPHRLSEVVRRDTLLCFTCGCANCIDLQTFTALMLERLGAGAPDVISVTTMPKDRAGTYYRDTGLKQLMLFERKEGPIMKQYQGHPCPRVYRLDADRKVKWIGSSPGESQQLRRVGLELAAEFGFSAEEAMALQPMPSASSSAP